MRFFKTFSNINNGKFNVHPNSFQNASIKKYMIMFQLHDFHSTNYQKNIRPYSSHKNVINYQISFVFIQQDYVSFYQKNDHFSKPMKCF